MDWNHLLQTALEGVLAAAAAALAPVLVVWAINQAKKIGLQVSADQQAKLEYLTKQAILRAEEWAAARVKVNLPVSAGDKLTQALNDLTASAGIDAQTASDAIHATLPQLGLGASAPTGGQLIPLAPVLGEVKP